MNVSSFDEIAEEFLARTFRVVWCSVATVDSKGRPRSRILHPYWEGSTGWIATSPNSHKAKHLQANPHVSLAYVSEVFKPVYVDATAVWDDDPASKQHVWDLFKYADEPMGYDPEPIFGRVDHSSFGVLRLTPWRIELSSFPTRKPEDVQVWHA